MADKSHSISIIYTDLKKAFDSVPHDLLLLKLRKLGINGKTLSWISDYLDQRTQRVYVGGKLSSSVIVESGVPQGGVLSGLFFALYVNDLPNVLRCCSLSLYADDAKIYSPILQNSAIENIQADIDAFTDWCKTWRLNINESKCFYMQYNPRSSQRSRPIQLIITV